MTMRLLTYSALAIVVLHPVAHSQDLELVCDGAGMVYDADGDLEGMPMLMEGTLIQIRGNEVEVSGNVIFQGYYELDAEDDAMYSFSHPETGAVGFLNRYSAHVNMLMDCQGEDCDGTSMEFSGSCSKQERKF